MTNFYPPRADFVRHRAIVSLEWINFELTIAFDRIMVVLILLFMLLCHVVDRIICTVINNNSVSVSYNLYFCLAK